MLLVVADLLIQITGMAILYFIYYTYGRTNLRTHYTDIISNVIEP